MRPILRFSGVSATSRNTLVTLSSPSKNVPTLVIFLKGRALTTGAPFIFAMPEILFVIEALLWKKSIMLVNILVYGPQNALIEYRVVYACQSGERVELLEADYDPPSDQRVYVRDVVVCGSRKF